MTLKDIVNFLFQQGLGELLVLHATQDRIFFGNTVYEKGRMVIRDRKLLTSMKPAQLLPCWESGIIGMITGSKGQPWESMTFYGLEKCDLPVDLGKTRHGALTAAENQYGDKLIDFVGSVYRAYQLMLDNHFLPVALLKEVKSKNGQYGLAVADLRAAPMSISLIRQINDVVRESVERHLVLAVDDVDMNADQFEKLFGGYITQSRS